MTWQIPTTRADGSALIASDLASYEIYYTTDPTQPGAVSAKYTVNGGMTTSYDISNLGAGTYYFAISAIDTLGDKSALSSYVTVKFGP